MQDKYISDLQRMESDLLQVKQRGKLVVNRKETEQNAFSEDVTIVKKKVSGFEKYLKRLKELVD